MYISMIIDMLVSYLLVLQIRQQALLVWSRDMEYDIQSVQCAVLSMNHGWYLAMVMDHDGSACPSYTAELVNNKYVFARVCFSFYDTTSK